MASSQKLSNYLRANRKRLGLSQEEVAYLLGAESGAKVCRYEQLVREPNFQTALACEAVFQKPASELFPGLYQKIAKDVADRARTLLRRTEQRASKRPTEQKRKALNDIITKQVKKSNK